MNDQNALQRLVSLLEEYREARQPSLVNYLSPSELRERLDLDRSDAAGDLEAVFTWLKMYLDYGVNTGHPAFVNRMWAGANLPSMLAEMVVAAANTSACTYESAPVSTLMEKHMIGQMLELVGFRHGEGQMTTGSSNANMIAMMCARNAAGRRVKEAGLFGGKRLFAFVNEEAHYSLDKAANVLGIGVEQLVKVGVDNRGAMQPELLEEAIERVVAHGGAPFFVTATAGTTVRGAYDPIEPLLSLRDRYGFWLHVDGAWGGAVIMSDSLRHQYLQGLERVDSFTCDFHKMLGSSLMCNFLLLNHSSHTFGTVLAGGDGSYLFRDTDDNAVRDLGNISLQCGRRVDSLKWFLDWKYYGRQGFAARIERYLALCQYAEEKVLATPELELVCARVSFNVCFRYLAEEHMADDLNRELRTRLYRRGVAMIGLAYVDRRLVLRLLVANTAVAEETIDQLVVDVLEVGRQLTEEGIEG